MCTAHDPAQQYFPRWDEIGLSSQHPTRGLFFVNKTPKHHHQLHLQLELACLCTPRVKTIKRHYITSAHCTNSASRTMHTRNLNYLRDKTKVLNENRKRKHLLKKLLGFCARNTQLDDKAHYSKGLQINLEHLKLFILTQICAHTKKHVYTHSKLH